jgi:hypothetical protein
MTKVSWKGQETSSKVFVAAKAGQCVSVDHMISTQVGFIPQLKVTLTKKSYTAATVFVDHYSRLKYIHLMTKLTSKETMEAKRAFKHFAKQHGLRILHYHCNIGQFADNAFKKQLQCKGAATHLMWGHAHFLNGIAEKPSGTFERVHRSSSSMHANNGSPPSTWPIGHMPSGAPFTSTILNLFWGMVPQG